MLQAVVRALIGLCVLALCVVLIIWVLGAIGIVLPSVVVNILYVIAVLVAVLWIVRLLQPHWGEWWP